MVQRSHGASHAFIFAANRGHQLLKCLNLPDDVQYCRPQQFSMKKIRSCREINFMATTDTEN